MSKTPSSILASGTRSRPCNLPQLAKRTERTLRVCSLPPSRATEIFLRLPGRCRNPASEYASQPTLALSSSLVSSMMSASVPTPAMTRNACSLSEPSTCSSLMLPVSMVRTGPRTAPKAAVAMSSSGTSTFLASRFPVPSGMSPRLASVPLRTSATARTVPSPPAAMTTSHPASSARRAAPCPGSSGSDSKTSGCGKPCLGTHVFNGGDRLFGAGLGRIEHQRNLAGGRRDADFWHQDLGPVAVNEPTHGEPTQRRGDARGACRNEGNKSIALHSALSLTGIARLRS